MTFTVNASLLDAIVLSVVSTEDTYGYKITQEVNKIIGVSESTLYPVLRRLQKDSNLEVYDMEYLGRNRRYYKITGRGKVLLNLYQEEWKIYKEKIDRVFNKDFSPLEPESFSEFDEFEEIDAAGEHYGGNDTSGKAKAANSKNSQEGKKNSEKMTVEEKIAKLKIGEKIDNLKIPEKISNLKIGEKIDNLKIPEKIENLKIGEKFDSLKIPEKISSLKIGEKIEDIGGKVDQFLNKESKAGSKDKEKESKEKAKTKNKDAAENVKNNDSEE